MPKELTKITKHWPISKILEVLPEAVEPMLEIGLNCIGCSASSDERLNDGMYSHGFSDSEVTDLVDTLNTLWAKEREKQTKKPEHHDFTVEVIEEGNKKYHKIAGVMFTDFALSTLHELLENFKGLQIRLDTGGCSGYNYTYDFKNGPEPDENEFQISEKLTIYMNNFTFNKLNGTIIDFETGLKGAGLKFINPNVKNSCHCGTSIGF